MPTSLTRPTAAELSASSTRGGDVERGAVRRGARGGADEETGGRDASPAPPPSPPPTLSSVASLLSARRNVIVLTGTGISVSRGIPEFRSPDGLYRTLDCAALGLTCPEDLTTPSHSGRGRGRRWATCGVRGAGGGKGGKGG
ncbi:hypothetical protein ACHAWF_016632 [Thalassiosira exigua]